MIILPSYEKVYFRVIGMYCSSCKPIVENQLKNVKGIKNININYITDTIVIEFIPEFINKMEIKKLLEQSGYKFIGVTR